MIETKPTRYFQVRPHTGQAPVPAIELAEIEVEAAIRFATGYAVDPTLALLLEDEQAGLFYVEFALRPEKLGRVRVMLEDAPERFVDLMRSRGLAVCTQHGGVGDSVRYLEIGGFS